MSGKRHILLIVAGILAAAYILVSQSGYYYIVNETQQFKVAVETSEDVEKTEKDVVFIYQAQDAVTHVLQFSFEHILHFLYSFQQEVQISVPKVELGDIAPVKVFLETLLQRIISPNAP